MKPKLDLEYLQQRRALTKSLCPTDTVHAIKTPPTPVQHQIGAERVALPKPTIKKFNPKPRLKSQIKKTI